MDWAEEIKMSLKKTAARKGRRSKSRDILKEKPTKNTSSTSTSSITSPSANKTKEISIDITLDLQQSDSLGAATSATSHKPSALSDVSKRPVRRIWAENGLNVLKNSKSKRNSFEDDRFQLASINSTTSSPPAEDDIPVIPDLDIKDDTLSSEMGTLPLVKKSPMEYNADLLSQNAFKSLGNTNLFPLTRPLHPPEYLDEADEAWDWDNVFTNVVAEINSDKTQKITIGPDEVPPAMHS